MATKRYKITFLNGKILTLSTGEINAIERFAELNGTDPGRMQYEPSGVHRTTIRNLVAKGILHLKSGDLYFVPGLLPVQGYSARMASFSLSEALAKSLEEQQRRTTALLAAEDFQVGYRYWSVRPGYEDAWTIASVTERMADYQVWRGGESYTPHLVIHVRRDGTERTFEKGEMIAVQGPWKAED